MLEEYQISVIEKAWQAYLSRSRMYLPLFDEPGVGKTAMYVNIASRIREYRKARGETSPVTLIVTENTARESQREKILKFDPTISRYTPLDVIVLKHNDFGAREDVIRKVFAMRVPYLILNYNQLVIHAQTLIELFGENDVLICDEADLASPSLGNHSKRFEVAKALALKAHYRIVSTGSMIRNRVDTLYNLFLLLDPIWATTDSLNTMKTGTGSFFWGSRKNFLSRYGVWDGNKLVGIMRKEELHRRLIEYGASMHCQDVLEIEEEKPVFVKHPLSPGQWRNYELVKQGLLELALEVDKALIQTGQSRARAMQNVISQISYARAVPGLSPENYFRLVNLSKAKRVGAVDPTLSLNLIDRLTLDQMANDGGNEKAIQVARICQNFDWQNSGGIVFYSPFRESVKEIAEWLKQHGFAQYGIGLITGDQTQHQRDEVQRGVEKGTIRIVGVSNAGGRSIDLQRLNTVIHLSPPWTHTEQEQALGRVMRYGQKLPVRNIYLVAERTVEAKRMMNFLAQKGRSSDDVRYGRRGRRGRYEAIESAFQALSEWL